MAEFDAAGSFFDFEGGEFFDIPGGGLPSDSGVFDLLTLPPLSFTGGASGPAFAESGGTLVQAAPFNFGGGSTEKALTMGLPIMLAMVAVVMAFRK